MTLGAGEVFAGYTIVRQLGMGGMGEVYLAQHPRLPRQEALKVLRSEISSDVSFRARFLREADSIAALDHPNIVTVYDRGETDAQLWIATQYVNGTDAAKLLEQHPAGLPADEVTQITTAIAQALDHAHERGVLHRDVKPANILLSQPDRLGVRRIYLADFGIARPLDDRTFLTATNFTLGTVAYAAPEQLMGKAIDGRADQYALAATAYNLLTGTTLFDESNPVAVISHHLSEPPPAPSTVIPTLAPFDPAFARALAKSPDDRYPRCEDFAHAVAAATAASGVSSPTAPTQQAPIPTALSTPKSAGVPPEPSQADESNRRFKLLIGVVTVLLLGVAAAAILPSQLGRTPTPHPTSAATPTASTLTSTSATTPEPPPPVTASNPAPPPVARPAPCVTGNDAPQVQEVMSRFSAEDFFPPDYSSPPSDDPLGVRGGNFNSCATLSAAAIAVARGSGSTPLIWLLFYKGSYIGPATPQARSLVYLDEALTTDDTVVLKYATGGSCMACPDRTFTIVRFRWQGDHVEMIGTPPN